MKVIIKFHHLHYNGRAFVFHSLRPLSFVVSPGPVSSPFPQFVFRGRSTQFVFPGPCQMCISASSHIPGPQFATPGQECLYRPLLTSFSIFWYSSLGFPNFELPLQEFQKNSFSLFFHLNRCFMIVVVVFKALLQVCF